MISLEDLQTFPFVVISLLSVIIINKIHRVTKRFNKAIPENTFTGYSFNVLHLVSPFHNLFFI